MDPSRTLARFLGGKVHVVTGDITKQDVDAIVNAANSTLLGGGGVDGAIHAKGGPKILEACRELRSTRFPRGLPTGQAVLTAAGQLPARHVIHTVGPITGSGQEPDASLLAACYRNSTGAYGYPPDRAAPVVSETIESVLSAGSPLEHVRLVFFKEDDARTFLKHQTFTTA
jgi:O-acetyl-ADP-ribose deacetylase (regulator of RNase III)